MGGEPGQGAVPARMGVLALVDGIRSGAVPVIGDEPGQVLIGGRRGPVQMSADAKVRPGEQVKHPATRPVTFPVTFPATRPASRPRLLAGRV